LIFGAICVLAAYVAPSGEVAWYSIIPPLLAITLALAFLTRHVVVSLGIAILAGGVLTHVPDATSSVWGWIEGVKVAGSFVTDTVRPFCQASEPGSEVREFNSNLEILAFLPPIFVREASAGLSGGF